jgi:uncharacterized membrane protein YfcA
MLTLPVLVYLIGLDPIQSSSYSLFIVGVTSLVGAIQYLRAKQVDYRAGLAFVVPSMIAVYLSRLYLTALVPGSFIMLLFAAFMFIASWSMIRSQQYNNVSEAATNYWTMVLSGLIIGVLTGLVGAGGGFLIVPTLVLLTRLPMKTAVGTSLFIIAIKSLFGFAGDYTHIDINWYFLAPFTLLAVIGIALGTHLSPRISNASLKKAFGWVILVVGAGIFYKELIIKLII